LESVDSSYAVGLSTPKLEDVSLLRNQLLRLRCSWFREKPLQSG